MVTVSELLLKPFSERSKDDQVRIVLAGKPRPELAKPIGFVKPTPSIITDKKFDVSLYDKEPWLTGCEKLQALFCWPCLLFVAEQSQWNTAGFYEFKYFQDGVVRHKRTHSHVEGMLMYQLFLHRNHKPVTLQPTVVSQDQLIARNREVTKRIIDVVCYMVTQQYPPQKGSVSKPLQVDDCIDILLSLKPHDPLNLSNDAVALLQKSPNLLPKLVSAIAGVVRKAIKKEIKKSTYVSLILSEHSITSSKSQLSTVLRYVIDGKVFERFLGFTDLKEYKTAAVVLKHMYNVIDMYELGNRLAAYSCDGAVLASNFFVNNLKASLREKFSFCLLVPCYYHEMDFTLEQSASHIKECYVFFNSVNAVKCFFQNNSKACEELNVLLSGSVLGLDIDGWSNSEFLRVLKTHRRMFIKFFESVTNKPDFWDGEDYVAALALQKILQEFDTIFQLEAFSKIFDYTCNLNFSLSSNVPESAFGTPQVENVMHSLQKEKEENAFEEFWVTVVAEILEAQEPKPISLKKAMEYDTKLLYRELYIKIIDCILQQIDSSYGCLKDLIFFHILNYEKHGKFVFCHEPLQTLLAVHGSYFDGRIMKNEINVLCNNTVFEEKSLYALMEFFVAANLKDTFKYLFRLAELTLTMPCKPASPVSGPCKFDKIRTRASGFESPDTISQDLTFLYIEEELMMELKESPNFIDTAYTASK